MSPEVRNNAVKNWLHLWAGDYSLVNETVTPDVRVYQDRFPLGHGSAPLPINNAEQFLNFVKSSRAPYTEYKFKDDLHFGEANFVALRWTLDAVWAGSNGS